MAGRRILQGLGPIDQLIIDQERRVIQQEAADSLAANESLRQGQLARDSLRIRAASGGMGDEVPLGEVEVNTAASVSTPKKRAKFQANPASGAVRI